MLKELHDAVLEAKSDVSTHDADDCPICTPSVAPETSADAEGGSVTYTEEELKAAVDAAVAELTTKVQELEAAQKTSEIDAQVAEVKADLEGQIAELQNTIDTLTVERDAARQEFADFKTELEQYAAEEAAAAELARVRAERIEKVKEVASFSEERIEERADVWASMSEEAFEALLADWREVAAASGKPASKKDDELPEGTAMTASRETKGSGESALRTVVRDFRSKGVDPRTLY